MKPKYKSGQMLVNKNNGRKLTIGKPITKRLMTKGYSGFSDEFTGEYSAVEFDDKGKQEHIEVSEDILDRFFESPL